MKWVNTCKVPGYHPALCSMCIIAKYSCYSYCYYYYHYYIVLEDTVAKPLSHCVLWFSSFSSSPTTQSGISSITLLVLALISKLSLVFYSKKAPDVSFLCLKLQLPVLAVSYVYVYMSRAEGAESPKKKIDSCLCYRHIQSAPQYLLSPSSSKDPDMLGHRSLRRA